MVSEKAGALSKEQYDYRPFCKRGQGRFAEIMIPLKTSSAMLRAQNNYEGNPARFC